jgi:hypothetical protein
MKATMYSPRKTKKSAEGQVADWAKYNPEQNWRVIKHEGLFYTARDYVASDEGRGELIVEVES